MTLHETIQADLDRFLEVLPDRVRQWLAQSDHLDSLKEVVIDLGRPIGARFIHGFETMDESPALRADIDFVTSRVHEFDRDNRSGIEQTLHRISGIRNRHGEIIGLTCRVGRAVYGTLEIIRDVIESGFNILMLGPPGVGKTTKLREVARVLADEFDRRVVVVDTNNEIGGGGDVPHPAIGRARRMQVPNDRAQAQVMIEAVENHMPEVVVVDEIGTEAEAAAARTIAERGVQLIATAHGNDLENLMANPTLSDLVGGIQAVVLSDEEAKRRGTQKTVLERQAPPTFDIVVEIKGINQLAIHHDVAETVDSILLGRPITAEVREFDAGGEVIAVEKSVAPGGTMGGELADPLEAELRRTESRSRVLRVLPIGISREHLEQALRERRVPATVTQEPQEADVAVVLERAAELGRVPHDVIATVTVRGNTYAQIEEAVEELSARRNTPREDFALREAAEAIERVLAENEPVELLPQNAYVRRLQRELIARRNLKSKTVGEEPRRRVKVLVP
ncbi:MAG: R3H domain-containing nucleic acid-binding protein [Armatimonadota bacterium]|jgi:stage III sporulation protein AA